MIEDINPEKKTKYTWTSVIYLVYIVMPIKKPDVLASASHFAIQRERKKK